MKRLALLPALALAIGLLMPGHTAEARSASESSRYQRSRIQHGAASGKLTRKETRKLRRNQQKLRRQYAHARRTGGGLTWQERRRLERARERQNARIYRQKHDRQRRR